MGIPDQVLWVVEEEQEPDTNKEKGCRRRVWVDTEDACEKWIEVTVARLRGKAK